MIFDLQWYRIQSHSKVIRCPPRSHGSRRRSSLARCTGRCRRVPPSCRSTTCSRSSAKQKDQLRNENNMVRKKRKQTISSLPSSQSRTPSHCCCFEMQRPDKLHICSTSIDQRSEIIDLSPWRPSCTPCSPSRRRRGGGR